MYIIDFLHISHICLNLFLLQIYACMTCMICFFELIINKDYYYKDYYYQTC